jgi:hypothetical protein
MSAVQTIASAPNRGSGQPGHCTHRRPTQLRQPRPGRPDQSAVHRHPGALSRILPRTCPATLRPGRHARPSRSTPAHGPLRHRPLSPLISPRSPEHGADQCRSTDLRTLCVPAEDPVAVATKAPFEGSRAPGACLSWVCPCRQRPTVARAGDGLRWVCRRGRRVGRFRRGRRVRCTDPILPRRGNARCRPR